MVLMRSWAILGLSLGSLWACGDGAQSPDAPSEEADMPDGGAASGGANEAEEPGPGTSGGSGANGGQNGTGNGLCETLEAVARPEYPKILIVLDRSGSMAGEPWDHATSALDALLTSYPDSLFGLSMYPSVGEELSCGAGDVVVDAAENTHAQVRDVLLADASKAIKDFGFTPTAATLEVARGALLPEPDDLHERIVLLVTDGQPNCNAAGPEKFTPDVAATLSALDSLLNESVRTFVVGYRTEMFADVMDQMAAHGGTEKHYAVDDAQTLVNAFEDVAVSVAPCTFELSAPTPGPEFVRVLLDGADLPFDDTGFAIENDTTVRLRGASCELMRDGKEHAIKVLVECEPVRLI